MTVRSQQLLRQTPPTTLVVMAVCAGLHLLHFVTNYPELHTLTLCPQLVLYQGDSYRIITSALFHGSFLHIGMNLMSAAAIGTMLEKRIGSIALLLTILWSILISSTIYISIAVLCLWVLDKEDLMRQHSVGFSGVLFHLSVLECYLGPQQARSVFGFFRVSPKLYPWALLIALQIVMPGKFPFCHERRITSLVICASIGLRIRVGLSFTGHLSGLLAGQMQYYQYLNFIFPSDSFYREMDSWSMLSLVTKLPNFARAPTDIIHRDPPLTISVCVCSAYQSIVRILFQLLETLYVIICGRGAEANSNLLLPRLPVMSSFSRHQQDPEDGENTVHVQENPGEDV